MSGNDCHPGFWAVVLRELSQIRAHSRYALAMVVLPLVSFALTWGLFSNQYPQGFEKDVLKGYQAYVSAYVDATYFLIYRQAMTGLVKTVRTLSAGIQIRSFQARGWSVDKAMIERSPLNLISRSLFNPTMGYATYIVPGVLISGFSWPVESMPHWIRAVSMLLPSTWGISGGLRLTQMGASFSQVREEWFWMWGLTLLYLILAWICVGFVHRSRNGNTIENKTSGPPQQSTPEGQ